MPIPVNNVVHIGLSALEIGGSVCGIPFVGAAAIILRDIVRGCEEVGVHKRDAKRMANDCVQLVNAINDNAGQLEGTPLQQMTDEVTAVLEKIQKRVVKWSRYNRVTTYLRNVEIGQGMVQCRAELETVIHKFQITAQIASHQFSRETRDIIQFNNDESKDILLEILMNTRELKRGLEGNHSGQNVARSIMAAGQMEMRNLREHADERGKPITLNERPSSPTSHADRQRYLLFQRGLSELHRMTGIPPSIKVLDGEIRKLDDFAIAGGTYSDIWKGVWLEDEKVALKALRNVKASDPRAKKRFEHEINVWADLVHEHILPFYGIVTNQGQHIHTVSPWEDNGNVLDYVKECPTADKRRLLAGAAQGLKYLHSRNIIHGNVKCTNILVSTAGKARICDFGMSKIVEAVTERSASVTLTTCGSARWLAPELINGTVTSPTMPADTYSFAMAILELITGKHPFSNLKREPSVVHAIMVLRKSPSRPVQNDIHPWLNDNLWDLMQACWHWDQFSRPSMEEVAARLGSIADIDIISSS